MQQPQRINASTDRPAARRPRQGATPSGLTMEVLKQPSPKGADMDTTPHTRLTIDNGATDKLDVLLEMTFSSGDVMSFKMRPPLKRGEGIAELQTRMLEEVRSRIAEILAQQKSG